MQVRPLQKGLFLPPALFANAHLLLNKLRFAAELKNKNIRFFARGLKLCKTLNQRNCQSLGAGRSAMLYWPLRLLS